MKKINQYILEKFKINKNIKNSNFQENAIKELIELIKKYGYRPNPFNSCLEVSLDKCHIEIPKKLLKNTTYDLSYSLDSISLIPSSNELSFQISCYSDIHYEKDSFKENLTDEQLIKIIDFLKGKGQQRVTYSVAT